MADEDKIKALLRELEAVVRERTKHHPLMLTYDHIRAVEPEALAAYSEVLRGAAEGDLLLVAMTKLVELGFRAGELHGKRQAGAPEGDVLYLGVVEDARHGVFYEAGGLRRPLPQRQDVRNHSPSGLSWGYGGSGAAQLALALLCHTVGKDRALPLYQDFKREFVACLDPEKNWKMTRFSVVEWAARREAVLSGADGA